MSGQWKARIYSLAMHRMVRTVFVLVVLAALALAAGAPYAWGGTGP